MISETIDRLNRRDELFFEWSNTDKKDHATLAVICAELATLFPRRAEWQRKHKWSYDYAIHRLSLPTSRSNKAKRVIDTESSAKARDELHGFCLMHYLPYAVEHQAGEVLKTKIAQGVPVESALELAKRVAIDGVE